MHSIVINHIFSVSNRVLVTEARSLCFSRFSTEGGACAVPPACPVESFVCDDWSCVPDVWQCDGIEDCGGVGRTLLACVVYFFTIEFLIFIDHYYLLHKWDLGKRIGQHAYHHVYHHSRD